MINTIELKTPISLIENDMMAFALIFSMKEKGFPVFYNPENQTVYTDTEETASKIRYQMLKK